MSGKIVEGKCFFCGEQLKIKAIKNDMFATWPCLGCGAQITISVNINNTKVEFEKTQDD